MVKINKIMYNYIYISLAKIHSKIDNEVVTLLIKMLYKNFLIFK
jgi:hypothetical protein